MSMQITELKEKLSWEIQEKPIMVCGGRKIPNHKALVRSDNKKVVCVHKSSYTPTPNVVFKGIVQKMIEATGYELSGFHEIQGGRKLFAYLKNPNEVDVVGNKVNEWLSIGNSHDGTTKLFLSTTQLMFRCSNQFSRAHSGRNFSFSHTSGHLEKVEVFKDKFDFYLNKRQEFLNQMERMSEIEVSNKDIENLMKYLLKVEEIKGEKREKLHGRTKNQLIKLEESIDRETADLGSNYFGLLNGVSHYTTHQKKTKHANFGNIIGTLANINHNAFNFIMSQVKQRQKMMIAV